MFGPGSAELFARLPSLPGLSADDAKRLLSAAYLDALIAGAEAQRTSGPARTDVVSFLRRAAAALESAAVFDTELSPETRSAAAFVAAEALSSIAEVLPLPDAADARLGNIGFDVRVEAGLLYLIAGFDPNAGTITRALEKSSPEHGSESDQREWVADLLVALCKLKPGSTRPSARPELARAHSTVVRKAILHELGSCIAQYLVYLQTGGESTLEAVFSRLNRLIKALSSRAAHAGSLADVYHWSRLVAATVAATATRAVVTVPPPAQFAESYSEYLSARARGSRRLRARPLLWPNASEFVRKCLPGPHQNAVVCAPTGSGKSFVAELAVSQACCSGWVLYLVPTNALANQIRADLSRALEKLSHVQVRAFLGGDEYSGLETDQIASVALGTVIVMTPEKCALALRLSPNAFSTLRLCVFDECHLIGEEERGVIAELVISHVAAIAPHATFLLMSAMLANPADLAAWLISATGKDAPTIRPPWRPSRTLRAVLGLRPEAYTRLEAAKAEAALLPPRRKRQAFEAPHALLANLQGPWTSTNDDDHALVSLPTSTTFKARRDGDVAGSWANPAAASLTQHFAAHGLTVLTFLPSSKHHPFSVAGRINVAVERIQPLTSEVEALLDIADDDLGVPSPVRNLLKHGVAVHSGALLDPERTASELAFREGAVPVMLATGTLAQGLNLPATAVVVAGTTVGDRREAGTPEGRRRATSQIMNALGRAGRAEYSSHGLGVVIPDEPLIFASPADAAQARTAAPMLSLDDDSTPVSSRLERFVNSALQGAISTRGVSREELAALAYLPVGTPDGSPSADILFKSFAISRRPTAERATTARTAGDALRAFGTAYLNRSSAPAWIPFAGYRAGVPFDACLSLLRAAQRAVRGGADLTQKSILSSTAFVFRVLELLPPQRARDILGEKLKATLAPIWTTSDSTDDPNWDHPPDWRPAWAAFEAGVAAYMRGETHAHIASLMFGAAVPVDPQRTAGIQPIPKAIALIESFVNNLSRAAGALVALFDVARENNATELPILSPEHLGNLGAVPLAIRFGCDSRDSLAWYRFGVRFRRPAHLLARVYPLPSDVADDAAAHAWVRSTRKDWLRDGLPAGTPATEPELLLLESVRRVLE